MYFSVGLGSVLHCWSRSRDRCDIQQVYTDRSFFAFRVFSQTLKSLFIIEVLNLAFRKGHLFFSIRHLDLVLRCFQMKLSLIIINQSRIFCSTQDNIGHLKKSQVLLLVAIQK